MKLRKLAIYGWALTTIQAIQMFDSVWIAESWIYCL